MKQIKLVGSYFSADFAYLKVGLETCTGKQECASRSKIADFFSAEDAPKLQYVYLNSALDFNKERIEHPVDQFADDALFRELDLEKKWSVDIYLQEVDLSISKSWW